MALTVGLVWGALAMFLTGVANLIWPGYGQAFLEVIASLYPGYAATPSWSAVITGTLYGFVDGAVAGFVLAWVYNRFASQGPRAV